MIVKYFINGTEYQRFSNEQKRQITEKLARAFGLSPTNLKAQDKRQTMIV